MTQIKPSDEMIERAARAIYSEFENRPAYAQLQMNGLLARELAIAALSTLPQVREAALEEAEIVERENEIIDAEFTAHESGWNKGVDEAAVAAGRAAWKHCGDDAYSQGMDAGARHQVKACVDAIRALKSATPQVERETCGYCNGRGIYLSNDVKTGDVVETHCLFCDGAGFVATQSEQRKEGEANSRRKNSVGSDNAQPPSVMAGAKHETERTISKTEDHYGGCPCRDCLSLRLRRHVAPEEEAIKIKEALNRRPPAIRRG